MEDAQQLLDQLNDIELPGNSGLPIAPGWIALAGLFGVAVLGILWWQRKRRQRADNAVDWQTPALAELKAIEERLQRGQTATVLADCSRLARRISIARAQRADVAGLTGQAWLQKLDQLSASHFFTRDCGQLLESAPYRKPGDVDIGQLRQILAAIQGLVNEQDSTAI